MRVKILILLFLLYPIFNEAKAQGVRLFTSADGLPSSQFIYMNRDKNGYIWICNDGGLARFDGLGLTSFNESCGINKLRSNTIYRFFTDRIGQCWIGTSRGLQFFHPETERFEHIRLDKDEDDNTSRKGKSINISDIVPLPDRNKILICAGVDGFFIVDIHSHKIIEGETKKIRSVLKNIVARRVFSDSKSRIWIVANKLGLLDLKTFRLLNLNLAKNTGISPANMEITDCLEDKITHTILFADNWNGVLTYDEKWNQLRKLNQASTPYINAQCLLQRKDGTLLVGCEKNGIGQIDISNHTIKKYEIKDCPFDITLSKVHAMIEDLWGNLYIGIYQKGLLVVPAVVGGFKFQSITEAPNIQNHAAITSFVNGSNGHIFVGTDGGGIFYGKDFDKMKKLPLPEQCNASIQHMIAGKDGKLWLATYGSGFFCYDHGTVKAVQNFEEIINTNVSCLQLDKRQKKLYIGNIGSGLNQLDLISGKLTKIQSGSPWVFTLKTDSKNRLWIGSSNCICYDPLKNKVCNLNLDAIDNSKVLAFLEFGGSMYIGTNNGLFVFNEQSDRCLHFPLDDNNKAVSVKALINSNNKFIWMSTNRGLIRFNPQNGDIRMFSSYEIRKVGDFHSNAVYKKNDETIVFGGDNGIVSFNPAAIEKENTEWNPIHFSSLYVNGKAVTYDINAANNIPDAAIGYASHIILTHDQNSFSIGFSAFNYAISTQLRYLYQLKGYETIWHTTSADNPQAVYNQLSPGKYILHVKSFNEEKDKQNSEATVEIIIKSPWYWSWWTKLLYAFILLAVLYTQYHTFKMRQRSRQRLRVVMSEFLRLKENYQILTQSQSTEAVSHNNPIDDNLKKKIMDVISNHISDTEFGVEELSREIALSRVHLYRRTKELFGCSPIGLLKSVRMKKAGLMLVQGKGSISDIAYEVGFSEPSYFSKSFKNYYNMSPKDFVARYRDNADEETVKQLFEL